MTSMGEQKTLHNFGYKILVKKTVRKDKDEVQ